MRRQLVVCLDGTNNRFNNRPTNVVRVVRALPRQDSSVLGYYDQGVGTFGVKEALFEWQKVPSRVFGLAFGWGVDRIIQGAYDFLANNYEDSDEIYICGFSRGAYAARALAALLHAIGLVPGYQLNLFEYAWSMLLSRDKEQGSPDFELQGRFKATFSRPVRIRFLGLFDTVSSVGWVYDPVIIPYTRNNPSVDQVRHAVAIDERRCFFRQNLWDSKPSKTTTLKEVWFAGVHSDIGGGYEPTDPQLSNVALRWMICEARACGLQLDATSLAAILRPPVQVGQDRIAATHDSMNFPWKIAEWVPRLVWDYAKKRRRLFFGSMPPLRSPCPRRIQLGATLHSSVQQRLEDDRTYRPPNLPTSFNIADDRD